MFFSNFRFVLRWCNVRCCGLLLITGLAVLEARVVLVVLEAPEVPEVPEVILLTWDRLLIFCITW